LFGSAYTRASTATNAINGFKKCGIFPFNPDVFGEADYAPSDVTDLPMSSFSNPSANDVEDQPVSIATSSVISSLSDETYDPDTSSHDKTKIFQRKTYIELATCF